MIRIKIRKEIDRKKYLLFAILSFVIVLAAWLIASESGAIKEIFLPKPQNVVNYYIESIKDGSLLQNTGISIYRITLGFVYAVLLGVPIGILVGTFKKAEAFINALELSSQDPVCSPSAPFIPILDSVEEIRRFLERKKK
jgi:NitT/TauT family transport system permease protein